jgi:autotransporter-associated beta strand protein
MNTTVVGGSYGVLNLAGAGAQVITGAQPLRYGNSNTAGQGDGLSAFVNLAAGTLSTGTIGTTLLPAAPTATNYIHYNYAGGTVKATAALASGWSPASGASATVINTLYGAIDNSAVAGAPSFTGGLTVDTNGNAITIPNAQPLLAASGVGVTQANLSVSGGSGYIGAPTVTFSRPAAADGVAASGYARMSGGSVAGIVITNPGVYAPGETPTVILLGGFASGAGTAATLTSSPLTTPNTSGGLTKIGAGTLTLSGAGNTYTGPTLVSAGTLQLDGSAATLPTTGSLTVNAGGTVGFTSGSASSLDLTGKPFTLGGGTLGIDIGASGVNDALTVGNFTLTANSVVSFNSIAAVTSGASYTLLTSANPISTGGFSLTGQTIGKLTLTPTINTNTVTVTPSLSEGVWNQTGGGDWSLGNPGGPSAPNWNNYKPTAAGDAALFGSAITGPATINVDAAHSLAYMRFDNAANSYTIGNGASSNLTIDNGTNAAAAVVSSGSHVIAENVVLASNLFVAPASGSTLTVSGNLSGTGKALQMVDAGTLVLSGTSNSYTGATIVNTGTLNLTGALTGGGATTITNGTLNVSVAGSITTAGTGLLTVSGASAVANINGIYNSTNGSGVAINAGGVLNTSGTVDFSGPNNQALFLGSVLGSGTWNVTGGSVSVNFASNGWGISNGSDGTLNVSAGSVTTAATNTFQVGFAAGGTGTLNISGTGLVTINAGTGSFSLGRVANATGVVNLDGGTLAMGRNMSKFATATGTFNFNGGLLQAGVTSTNYMSGLTTANVRNGGAKIDTNGFDVSIGQALVHSTILGDNATDGGLTKSGVGTLTLAGANTYNGSTIVNGGTLQLDGSAAITPTTSGVTVNTGGTLGSTAGLAGTLDLTGKPLSLGGGTLAFDIGSTIKDSITVNQFSLTGNSFVAINPIGAFTNGGSYTVLTSATPISTGGFSLSGLTVGRLSVTPTVNTNTVTITPVLSEGIWNFNGNGNWDTGGNWTNYKPTVAGDAAFFGSAITGPAVVSVDAPQTVGYLRFNNANSYTIGTLGSSNLTLDNVAAPALIAVNSGSHVIAENVALTSNLMAAPVTGTTLTISGDIIGTSKTVQLVEAGTLELSGSGNSYTGATTVSNGTLILSGNRTAQANGGFNIGTVVGNTGTLNVTNGAFTVGAAGSNFLVSNGTGTTGIMNQSGGSLTTIGNQLLIGNLGGTGTYSLSGGTLTTIAGGLGVTIGVNTGSTGVFNLSGTGTLTMPATSTLQIARSDNSAATDVTGSFNQTGGTATVGILRMGGSSVTPANNANANATLNLTGGTFAATTFALMSGADTSTSAINIGGTADVTLPAFPTARGSGSTATINFDGGILRPAAASATYMGGLTNAFIKAGGVTFNTGFDITVTQDLLTDGVSTGGGLTKAGANTLTLTGTNTYTGGSTITGGILSVTNANALGNGDVTFNGGNRLFIATGLDIANDIIIGPNTGASGNGMIQAGSAAGTATVSGAITINNAAAAGGHFGAPTANTTLHVASAITSAVTVTSRIGTVMYSGGGTGFTNLGCTGTVKVGANNGLATSAAVDLGAYGAAGTLDLNGFDQSLVGITKNAQAATIANSSTTANSTLTTTGTSTYAGVIQDVTGAGTQKVNLAVASGALTLTGANTFSGNIAVNGGTLSATKLGASLNTRTITVASGAVLEFGTGNVFGSHNTINVPEIIVNGGTITNKELIITDPLLIKVNNALNNVTLNGGTITATEGNQNSNIDPINRPDEGYGAWCLNGTVTSTGTSTINTGAVTGKGGRILLSSNTADTNFNVVSGTLTVSAPLQTGESTPSYGLTKSGAGTLALTAANIYTGNTTINAGTLTLADNAQLKFVLGATSGLNNSIAGSGTANLDGDFVIDTAAADALASGTWTLENVSTLTGAYGPNFSVVGFVNAGNNKWTKVNGLKIYTFDETTGILTLGQAGYASWAATNAPTGGVDDDFDGDGVTNGVEYVLGGDKNTNDLAKLPKISNSGSNMVVTFERSQASIDGSTTIDIRVGTNLVNWPDTYPVPETAVANNPGLTVVKDSPVGFDTVTLTLPRAPDAKKFASLKVVIP